MKLHEHQAKALFRSYGIKVPPGRAAFSVDEAVNLASELGGSIWAVKAQIHAGGRGKGGGVKLARSLDEVRSAASAILGMQLVTHQTGPAGQTVRRLLIEGGVEIARELYLGMLVDRASGKVAVIASAQGGMEIEEVAKRDPSAILKELVDPSVGLADYQARKLAFGLGLGGKAVNDAVDFMRKLYRLFVEKQVQLAPLFLQRGEPVSVPFALCFLTDELEYASRLKRRQGKLVAMCPGNEFTEIIVDFNLVEKRRLAC